MDSNMKVLIERLGLSDDCIKQLQNSSIEKIVGSKDKTDYCFYINIDHSFSIELYIEFVNKLKETFKNIENINVVFNVKEINNNLLIDYLKYIIEFYSKESSMLSMFVNNKIEVNDNEVIVYVDNIAELKKLEEYKIRFEEYLNRVGYKNIKLNILVDEEESIKLQEEIESSKVDGSNVDLSRLNEIPKEEKINWKKNYTPKKIETVDDPKVILGRIIDDENIRIDTVSGKMPLVTFEAEVFDMELIETKSDLRIITLNITDRTDSV